MPKPENIREAKQIKLFGLLDQYINSKGVVCNLGRGNIYKPDACFKDLVLPYLGFDWFVELKTWRDNNSEASSSRDTHLKKIEDWASVPFWVFSEYPNADPQDLTGVHYALTADDMKPFIFGKAYRKIMEGSNKQMGMNTYNDKIRKAIMNDPDAAPLIELMDSTMKQHGTKQNDPRIPVSIILGNGQRIADEYEAIAYFADWVSRNDPADLARRFRNPSWVA
jgi:hypothetical protein